MTLRELAESIARKETWDLSDGGGAYTLDVPVAAGRRQKVILSPFDHEGAAMVRFVSRVGSARELDVPRCRKALELNLRFPTGSLAIEGDSLVMTDTRPLATTTPESSACAVRFLARQADEYERFMYRTDRH